MFDYFETDYGHGFFLRLMLLMFADKALLECFCSLLARLLLLLAASWAAEAKLNCFGVFTVFNPLVSFLFI